VHTIDAIHERLDAVVDTEGMLTAGSEAFELIHRVCAAYVGNAPESYAMWMSAIPLACEGRDELACGYPVVQLPEDFEAVSEDDAADRLAALAERLGVLLRSAADSAARREDQHACRRAAAVADEIRERLAPDG